MTRVRGKKEDEKMSKKKNENKTNHIYLDDIEINKIEENIDDNMMDMEGVSESKVFSADFSKSENPDPNYLFKDTEVFDDNLIDGIVVGCLKLNIRSKPDKTSKVLNVINASTIIKIDIANSTSDWFKVIDNDGNVGYCDRNYLYTNLSSNSNKKQ